MERIFSLPLSAPDMGEVSNLVQAYHLLVVPTDTVYGIGVRPDRSDAISRLLAVKGRGRQMPPPIVGASWRQLSRFVAPTSFNVEQLSQRFWPGALTLILPTAKDFTWDLGDRVGTVAVRVPGFDPLLDLLAEVGPLALTSANLTGQPPARSCDEARAYFGDVVGAYLDGGASRIGVASTILDLSGDCPRIIRQGSVSSEELSAVVGPL